MAGMDLEKIEASITWQRPEVKDLARFENVRRLGTHLNALTARYSRVVPWSKALVGSLRRIS
jgi:hypothetical protein